MLLLPASSRSTLFQRWLEWTVTQLGTRFNPRSSSKVTPARPGQSSDLPARHVTCPYVTMCSVSSFLFLSFSCRLSSTLLFALPASTALKRVDHHHNTTKVKANRRTITAHCKEVLSYTAWMGVAMVTGYDTIGMYARQPSSCSPQMQC